MMRPGHYAVATPLGLGAAYSETMWLSVPWYVATVCAVVTVQTSTWNDLDHPRFKGKYHPGAALVRASAWVGYKWRTDRDKDREDFHRGPSHCLEWCVLVGVAVWALVAHIPFIAVWAPWLSIAVTLGCASHVLADWPTPSGVPISCIYNYFRYGEVWKRHSLRWFATDSAGERFLAVPVMFFLTGVMALAMVGWLGPMFYWLVGW